MRATTRTASSERRERREEQQPDNTHLGSLHLWRQRGVACAMEPEYSVRLQHVCDGLHIGPLKYVGGVSTLSEGLCCGRAAGLCAADTSPVDAGSLAIVCLCAGFLWNVHTVHVVG
jgi:hypothetical protein